MRRQTEAGGIAAGSGRAQRLDPFSLPLTFDARDTRADGGLREITLSERDVTIRRSIAGIAMTLRLRIADFSGVTLVRSNESGSATFALLLEHHDPSLSIPLSRDESAAEVTAYFPIWAQQFDLPCFIRDEGAEGVMVKDRTPPSRAREMQLTVPAPRRRRRNALRFRRSSFLMRRKTGAMAALGLVQGEREIIARS